jgi:endogenous inhibitor of DNA gyrase (YacG/DUF329 family)
MIKVQCPICGRPMQAQGTAEWPHFPFCSDRCRLIDLGRWLGESYRIIPETEGEAPASCDDESEIP